MKAERRGLGVRSFVVLSFVVALVAGAAGVFPFRQIIAQRRSVELAEAQLDALIEENRRLEQQIGALESPQEVERLAREQFGLVMPGDVAYVAVVPPGSEPADLEPDVALEKPPPWWRKVWNFLTGGDLVEE